MVINYKKTQKTILRVSPRVPLADHLPAICEKCEFDVESTVLLRDVHSLSPLDLSCSLNDYAIREVYARDPKSKSSTPAGHNCQFGCYSFIAGSAGPSASPVSPVSPSHAGIQVWKLIWADPPTRGILQVCRFCSCVQCFQARTKLKRKKKTKAFSANLGRAGKNRSRYCSVNRLKYLEGGLLTLVIIGWVALLFATEGLILFWLVVCSIKETAASAPASPVLVSKPRPLSMALPSSSSCPLGSSTALGDGSKKRRAPQPPVVVSQGCSDISPRRRINSEPNTRLELDQVRGLKLSGHGEGTAVVAPVFKSLNHITTGGWFESRILRWVFSQEDKTQSSSASRDLQCCCSRNGSCEREFTRFVCLHVHVSGKLRRTFVSFCHVFVLKDLREVSEAD